MESRKALVPGAGLAACLMLFGGPAMAAPAAGATGGLTLRAGAATGLGGALALDLGRLRVGAAVEDAGGGLLFSGGLEVGGLCAGILRPGAFLSFLRSPGATVSGLRSGRPLGFDPGLTSSVGGLGLRADLPLGPGRDLDLLAFALEEGPGPARLAFLPGPATEAEAGQEAWPPPRRAAGLLATWPGASGTWTLDLLGAFLDLGADSPDAWSLDHPGEGVGPALLGAMRLVAGWPGDEAGLVVGMSLGPARLPALLARLEVKEVGGFGSVSLRAQARSPGFVGLLELSPGDCLAVDLDLRGRDHGGGAGSLHLRLGRADLVPRAGAWKAVLDLSWCLGILMPAPILLGPAASVYLEEDELEARAACAASGTWPGFAWRWGLAYRAPVTAAGQGDLDLSLSVRPLHGQRVAPSLALSVAAKPGGLEAPRVRLDLGLDLELPGGAGLDLALGTTGGDLGIGGETAWRLGVDYRVGLAAPQP